VKLSAVRTNEGRLFQTVETQHENRRAAMFVDEDYVDSRSDVDDLRASDCLYLFILFFKNSTQYKQYKIEDTIKAVEF